MDTSKIEVKKNELGEQQMAMPLVPRSVQGRVIYSQVALDMGTMYGLGVVRQTALNLEMAKAIVSGKLRSYNTETGLPCKPYESSVYSHSEDIVEWLKSIRYPLKWGQSEIQDSDKSSLKNGTEKKWTEENKDKLCNRHKELRAEGHKDYTMRCATEFDISTSLVRRLINEHKEDVKKRKDTSLWVEGGRRGSG